MKYKGQPPLNRQKFRVNSVMNSNEWIVIVNSDRWIVNFFLSSKHGESFVKLKLLKMWEPRPKWWVSIESRQPFRPYYWYQKDQSQNSKERKLVIKCQVRGQIGIFRNIKSAGNNLEAVVIIEDFDQSAYRTNGSSAKFGISWNSFGFLVTKFLKHFGLCAGQSNKGIIFIGRNH